MSSKQWDCISWIGMAVALALAVIGMAVALALAVGIVFSRLGVSASESNAVSECIDPNTAFTIEVADYDNVPDANRIDISSFVDEEDWLASANCITIDSAHGMVTFTWDANGIQLSGDPNAFPLAAHTFFMDYVYEYIKAYYNVRKKEIVLAADTASEQICTVEDVHADWPHRTPSITIGNGPGQVCMTFDANGVTMQADPNFLDKTAHTFFTEHVYRYMQEYYDERNCPDIESLCTSGRVCEVMGHQWGPDWDRICQAVVRPDGWQGQKCSLCGKQESRQWQFTEWE